MSSKRNDCRRFRIRIWRLFIWLTWSIDGLWWSRTDKGDDVSNWFFVGTAASNGITIFQIVILKARLSFGWA